MEDVAEPKSAQCVNRIDIKEVVDSLIEIVWQQNRQFHGSYDEEPFFNLVPSPVRLLVPLDVAVKTEVKCQCFKDHKDHESVYHYLFSCGEISILQIDLFCLKTTRIIHTYR